MCFMTASFSCYEELTRFISLEFWKYLAGLILLSFLMLHPLGWWLLFASPDIPSIAQSHDPDPGPSHRLLVSQEQDCFPHYYNYAADNKISID